MSKITRASDIFNRYFLKVDFKVYFGGKGLTYILVSSLQVGKF